MELDSDITQALGRDGHFYHVGMACHRLEVAMAEVGDLFGVGWTPIADDTVPGLFGRDGPCDGVVRRVHSIGSAVAFELLEGGPGSTWDTPKVVVTHHVAYWSLDVGADVRSLQGEGWSIELAVHDADGHPTEFAYMVKPGAIRIELVHIGRRPRYLALIDQGAR
jgi:Glyoxalase/Bleomycin resistance protein/Dioxygenase superfamily